MSIDRVLVVGAGSALGYEIVRILRAKGVAVKAAYRTKRQGLKERLDALGAGSAQLDLKDRAGLDNLLQDSDAAIFTPILTIAQNAARALRDHQRAIFFSSNNVAVDPEAEVYARLRAAEGAVLKAAPAARILRPTMIYGYPGDGNLSRLIQMMRRSPVAFLADGDALQQPVYYRDLAEIAVNVLFEPPEAPPIRAVAGPAPVSMRALYKAAANAARARPVVIPVPAAALAPAVRLVERAGLNLPLRAAQLARAGRDKTPASAPVLLGPTALEEGLQALAAALDGDRRGA